MIQGTDTIAANSIANTGFATVANLDDGYYGKGCSLFSFRFAIPVVTSSIRFLQENILPEMLSMRSGTQKAVFTFWPLSSPETPSLPLNHQWDQGPCWERPVSRDINLISQLVSVALLLSQSASRSQTILFSGKNWGKQRIPHQH